VQYAIGDRPSILTGRVAVEGNIAQVGGTLANAGTGVIQCPSISIGRVAGKGEVAQGGATVNSAAGLTARVRYSSVTIVKTALNVYKLTGDSA
jgi:hypothetical protein